MARPFQVPYEPEYETLTSPSTNTPVAPQARGETPISFKTNVNRAKTKRWVEAKKYSYDGNDWGDDEYEEYDDEPLPMPQPANFSQSTNDLSRIAPRDPSRPPLPSMDRSRSMDQVATLGVGPAESRSRSADRNAVEGTAGSAPSNKPLPFVRPADIYKRMQERRQQSPDTPRNDSPSGLGRSHPEPVSTSQLPATADHELQLGPGSNASKDGCHGKVDDSSATPRTAPGAASLELPDFKRLSGFDADFLASDSSVQKEQSSDPQQTHQLQHNPSLGFRSVVHQAFDVPDTPSTTVDSVARSNSDSTSVISPIIGARGPNEEKTPTIVEEPGEISTPKDTNDQAMLFKPGHRRDLSLPSPGNSPSRKPIINNSAEATPPSVLAEMSSETPSDSPRDSSSSFHQPLPHRASVLLPQTGSDRDLPAPLNFGANPPADSPIKSHEEIPVIIPSNSAETSPQDTESDRLRKEIIRSLSRETTPSAETEQQNPIRPQTARQDTEISQQDSLIPSEYERYWSEQVESSPQDLKPPAPVYGASQNVPQQDLYSTSPMSDPAPAAPAQPTSEPKLKRRFSWESSSSEEVPPVEFQAASPSAIPIPGQFPLANDTTELAPETVPNETEMATNRDLQQTPEKPKLTLVTPAAMENSSDSNESYLPEVINRQSMEQRSPLPEPKMPPTVEPTLLGFRDIMGIQSSDERVRAFDRTRDQFTTIDTGLKNWLQVVIRAHPEHMDVVEQSMKAPSVEPKAVVSKGKFPKLSSLGHFTSSNQDGPPPGSGHVRRPSAPLGSIMNKQQVEQRGKDLLHTAGALGGRAGEAAKGFFAKGRNKLKRGETDKGFHRVRGYRREIQLSDFQSAIDQNEAETMTLKRNAVQFASLPIIRRAGDLVESTQLRWDVEPQQAAASESRRRSADDINIAFLHRQMNTQGRILRKPLPSEMMVSSHSTALSSSSALQAPLPSILRRKTVSTMTKIDRKPLKGDDKRRFPVNATVATYYCVDSNCGKEAGLAQATAKPQERGELLTAPYQNATFYSGLSDKITNKNAINDGKVSPCDAEDAEAPPPAGAHLLGRVWRGLEPSPVDLATSTRLSVPPPLHCISTPPISSLGTLEAYSGLQPSSGLGLARPSQSPSARAEISLNLIGVGQPENLNPSNMLGPANQMPVPSVAGTATTPSPGLSRWYAGRSRLSSDEAEIFTHSRGVSHSSETPGFPYESGSVAGSSSPRTGSNAQVSQDDLFDADLAARGSPQRNQASPQSKPPTEMFRLFRRNRGPSFSDEPSPKTDRSRRGAFDRLGAWFGRSQQQQQNKTQAHGRAPESSVAQTMEWLRPVSSHPAPGHTRFYSDDQTGRGRRRSNVESQTSFEGQHPPPEGYFAPESFSRFRRSPRASKSSQQLAAAASASLSQQPDSRLAPPDRLPSPAGSFSYSGRVSPQSPPPPAPPPHLQLYYQQQPMTLPPSPHHSQLSPQLSPPPHLTSPIPQAIPRTPPSRGRSVDRAYAQDLHLRSRSPKTFPPRPEERSYPSTDTSDPANNLGTFRSNPRTSRIGDQELPWKLTLPSDSDEEHAAGATATEGERSWLESTTQRLLQSSRLPTYEEDSEVHGQPQQPVVPDEKAATDQSGDQNREQVQGQDQAQAQSQHHPHRGEARAVNADDAPVELPVQWDDDSGEEITMSSTAYPGQEWRPLGFSGWEY
ncbi:hypothetical protein Asppvi_006301 [Aspergillus pseudoviridinutans]|uniref:Uncharacterized protein n=1 Tax=Aspergillus pseudoviridinutans TaxID=1517512 RepID=A0A9P3BAS1_9EURO|nr:uncharacterized protein Asppvi_006301 [Aspergillus pseudoviridinutans]GIJ87395.1 hypothetical protein Asppvi_006301 [Aspergillus pseudoviridinutans]